EIVVPNDRATRGGNSADNLPFANNYRLQQVCDASQFSAIAPSGGWINAIYFRVDGGVFTATDPSMQVNLSTTSKGPDGLSSVFAENVGSDDKIVFGPGALTLDSLGPVRIQFDSP